MRLLLDSHVVIWSADDPIRVSPTAMTALQNPANELVISVVSIWEMAIKVANGKLPLSLPFRPWIEKAVADLGLTILPITLDHAERQIGLPFHHRDPFDRLLAAQSLVEGVAFVSADVIFDAYGVTRLWN